MMARSKCSNQRPDTLMQDRLLPARRNHLQRTAGPYKRVIFASRFWRLQSPLFLDERTSLVATCSPKLAERPRPPKLAERRRKAEGASDTHHDLDGRDGFRGKLNPSCDLLPDGLFNLPDGQISKNLSSPFCKNISVFQKCKPDYMICRPVPLRGGSRSSRTRGGMRWTRMRR